MKKANDQKMASKTLKQILYTILLLISIASASAANMTIQELIDSYDYSYHNGTINITSYNDYMLDRDSDGTNDTLIINLTTDAATGGTYKFIVGIMDDNGILINETSKSITASEASANVNFPSELLSKSKFNYTVRVNDNSDNLVFRKFNIETQTYTNYETGTNITSITDQNVGNNFLRIGLTINSSQAITTNITVTLAYNSSTISQTEEETLSSGVQTVYIDFDNETIKRTHYNSNFTIDTATIGNKIFDLNQNTSVYNYEDFAKTSYIKSIVDGKIDPDNNNLSEFLEINFTVEVKTADTYIISYDLYDEFDNFVINISKTESLSTGTQNVQTLVNGSEVYKTKINGPYVLSFVKLDIGNDTQDIIFDAHTTNQTFYTDYERPPLPDLKVAMDVVFDELTNITNITVNLSNIGQAPAFNLFLDIFDNITYENNRSLAFLSNGDAITYKFNATNSSNATLFTAIADFDNLVDEMNESNNIVQNAGDIESKPDGESCTSDGECLSNYCDNDGVGLSDDNWCFTPYNTYFDGQETSYCEYSTDNGISDCDERQAGADLNKCVGTSYYEDECSSTCGYQDITSVFECTESGCSCTTSECDGISPQGTINYCDKGGQTYFQDDCGSTATAEDTDNICRSANSLQSGDGCTADSQCNGVTAGTGDCDSSCNYNPDATPPSITILSPINNTVYQTGSIDLNWTSNESLNWCAYSLNDGENNTEICSGWSGLDGWSCRNEITLQNNFNVDMVGTPVRINIIKGLPDFNSADFKNNGEDVIFTDSQDNILPSFVEAWDESNEQTIAWVNATILADSNTTIYLYHCNENADAYNNYNFMNSFENFSSGSTPSGWQISGSAGFNDTTTPFTQPYSAYFNSGSDGNNFNPTLPPSTNYTIDFHYYTASSVDNGYLQDGGNAIFRWETSTGDYPSTQWTCLNESGEDPTVKVTDRWIRAVVIRDREKDHTRIRYYDNETLIGQCNGTLTGYGTSQSRFNWSFTGGNGGTGRLRIDNFKVYKNFGWDTSDVTIYAGNKVGKQNQNITLNLTQGSHNITIYGNDTSGNMGQSDYVYFEVNSVSPTINLDLIYPTENINVTQNEWFKVTVNVTCLNDNCGEINVSLDPETENNLTTYNGTITTTGAEHNEGYSVTDVSSQDCSQGNCDGTNSWEAGFDDANPANTQIDWYFNVSSLGISGSDITEIIITGGGCWHGGSARSCDGSDDAEFASGSSPQLQISLYNWGNSSYNAIGSEYEITPGGNTASGPGADYQEYNRTKSSSFVDGYVSSEEIIKVRYDITGAMMGSSYDVIGVYDFAFLTITYSTGKGLISIIIGATPFYTNESNPRTITLNQSQSQIVTFWVNATGAVDSTYKFFVYVNITSDMSISNQTGTFNVTIQEEYTTSPSIGINLIYPTEDLNVSQNQFFNFTTEVCCYNANCSEVNISLDPVNGLGSTYYSVASYDGHYNDSNCNSNPGSLYSGNSDDGMYRVTLGFDFPYFNQNKTNGTYIYMDTNGRLSWSDTASDFTPSESEMQNEENIATNWQDLGNGTYNNEYICTNQGAAPNRYAVFRWDSQWYNGVGSAQLEVVLLENGSIDINYGTIDTNTDTWFRGVSQGTGNDYNYNTSGSISSSDSNKGRKYTYQEVTQPKGLISTTTGATPFYTNGTNPTTISLNQDECQNITWWVNATGTVDTPYTFFTYANLTSDMSISNITNTINITIQAEEAPQDQSKFYIKDTSGTNIAWFGDAGNIVIKGTLEQNSNFQRTSSFAFVIRNNAEDVLIIENNGSMYIDGTLFENQGTLTSLDENNDFRVKNNNSELVSFVNETGYIFLKGTLTENGNP